MTPFQSSGGGAAVEVSALLTIITKRSLQNVFTYRIPTFSLVCCQAWIQKHQFRKSQMYTTPCDVVQPTQSQRYLELLEYITISVDPDSKVLSKEILP